MAIESDHPASSSESWEFAGWGTADRIVNLESEKVDERGIKGKHTQLGEWASTAICGNDITSSCLYVSALCAAQAGKLAPIVLLVVAGVLYLFRRVYAEVGSALPLNGGTYTVLLNTTNKKLAAGAACLTLLSYVATAVISAGEAMHYAHNLIHGLNVLWATAGLLGFFALLNIIGVTESAVVALVIFVFHMFTLVVLSVTGTWFVLRHPELLQTNWATPAPGGIVRALFFGFAAAMLGISGFESSANFIEEQKKGVFAKTLRNMWVAVAVFNPLMALLALGLLPLAAIQDVPPDLLAQMGDKSWGGVLRTWVSIDAVAVLSGAVLTSYVGVVGLIRRMSLDRCLPQVLLAENRFRKTNHWIIIAFFLICCSILYATSGNVSTLAGVYTISFLCVMALFAIGNMLLKSTRGSLPRETRASWPVVTLALCAVLIGLVGNLLLDPAYFWVFMEYFVGAVAVVAVMFLRIQLLRLVLFVSHEIVTRTVEVSNWVNKTISSKIAEINATTVIYFTKEGDPAELNRAALYVMGNEQTSHLIVIHAHERSTPVPESLAKHLSNIDHLYPALRIDFVAVEGEFGPLMIERLSKRLGVPKNYMFIGTPGDRFPHRIEALGGVRLVI